MSDLAFDRRAATYEQIRGDFGPIVARYHEVEGALLPLLHEAQERYGWVSEHVVKVIAEGLRITPPSVYAVLTYYHELTSEPPADVPVIVCAGPACRVGGGPGLLSALEEETGITVGDTSRDMRYSLATSACLGICMHAPAATVGHRLVGRIDPARVGDVLSEGAHA